MTGDRRLNRTRWVEAELTVLALAVFLWLSRQLPVGPGASSGAALLLVLVLLGTVAVNVWQYRVMDEFRRERMQKTWAITGYAGFLAVTGLIVWRVLTWPGLGLPPALARTTPLTFTLLDLYLPWTAMAVTLLVSTAFLYWRDVRSR